MRGDLAAVKASRPGKARQQVEGFCRPVGRWQGRAPGLSWDVLQGTRR